MGANFASCWLKETKLPEIKHSQNCSPSIDEMHFLRRFVSRVNVELMFAYIMDIPNVPRSIIKRGNRFTVSISTNWLSFWFRGTYKCGTSILRQSVKTYRVRGRLQKLRPHQFVASLGSNYYGTTYPRGENKELLHAHFRWFRKPARPEHLPLEREKRERPTPGNLLSF